MSRSDLFSFKRTCLTKIDANMVSAFVERLHLETSLFHMPFGEMSITPDECLVFFTCPSGASSRALNLSLKKLNLNLLMTT